VADLTREDPHFHRKPGARTAALEPAVTFLLDRLEDQFGHRGDDFMAPAYAALMEQAITRYRQHSPPRALDVLLFHRLMEVMSGDADA
jgi:hypothetical protein